MREPTGEKEEGAAMSEVHRTNHPNERERARGGEEGGESGAKEERETERGGSDQTNGEQYGIHSGCDVYKKKRRHLSQSTT